MQLLGRSLKNAGQAAMAVATAVLERRELTEPLLTGTEGEGELRVMTDVECRDLLAGKAVGRLAYIARAGTPDIAVVNYSFDGRDVLIRSGPGPKLQAAERGDRVAFEVDVLDADNNQARSVVVHGTAKRLSGQVEGGPTPWARGPRHHVIRIRPSRITGRSIG